MVCALAGSPSPGGGISGIRCHTSSKTTFTGSTGSNKLLMSYKLFVLVNTPAGFLSPGVFLILAPVVGSMGEPMSTAPRCVSCQGPLAPTPRLPPNCTRASWAWVSIPNCSAPLDPPTPLPPIAPTHQVMIFQSAWRWIPGSSSKVISPPLMLRLLARHAWRLPCPSVSPSQLLAAPPLWRSAPNGDVGFALLVVVALRQRYALKPD